MRYDDDRFMLGYHGGRSPSRASGLLAKVLSVTAAAVVLISAVAVSLVLFAVALVALVVFGLYLWWKTRAVRKELRAWSQEMDVQGAEAPERESDNAGRAFQEDVVDAEVVREVHRPPHQRNGERSGR
ncbi:MAG: hypothetical protein IRZ28_22445 [Steroidobacteraceae bacterium]|nr:hypothetical protein [Steroidobacteraceae bacterium]